MTSRSTILVSGSLAFDQILLYSGRIQNHLPDRRDAPLYLNFRAQGPFRMWGGCGGNVAYTLSLFSAQVRLCSIIGADGVDYLPYLKKLNIDPSEVIILANVTTPTGILLVDSEGDQILFFGESEYPKNLPLPSLKDIILVSITAGIPEYSIQLMKASQKAGIPFIVDPGKFIMDVSPDLLTEGLEGADSLIVNEYERSLLMRRTGLSWDELASKITALITTFGSKGVLVETQEIKIEVPATRGDKIVDPNGAGDAFFGGYTYGRSLGFSPPWCARIGAVASSFAIESKGAQSHRFTLESFKERLSENYGSPERPLFKD